MKKRLALSVILACVLTMGSMTACGSEVVDSGGMENYESTETALEESFDEIAEKDIYEVLETEDAVYYATAYGIYRVTAEGSECIYNKEQGKEGFSGTEPHMCVYENRLYFKTDVSYKDGDLDWQDCGIRQVDLQTLKSDIVISVLSQNTIFRDYRVGDGFLTLITVDSNGEERYNTILLEEKGKIVYNNKSVEELSDSERQEYGLETSLWLLENPGKLISVASRTFEKSFALLDMDGDGRVEEISLRPNEAENYAYSPLDFYVLSEGDKVLREGYAENMINDLWAISLNGEDILLVLYAAGPSDDPMTWFYRYEDGTLIEAGTIATDIRDCEITEDGIIRGVIRNDVIQTDFITAQWQMNEKKQMEQMPQDAYEFRTLNEVQMLQPLTVYTEPAGRENFILEPQIVKFTKVSGDFKWILLEASDGTSGWLEVIDYRTVEQNKNTMDVFDWETMIFAD